MTTAPEQPMEELMTVDELATYLHFSKKTIYHLVKQKTLPVIRISDSLRFSRADIDYMLKRRAKSVRYILAIDDTESVCTVICKLFENEGHVVITATTGADGLEQMTEIKFDHIFLDLLMPDMNGVETLRRIRQLDSTVHVTIITGHPDSELVQQARGYGVDRVLVKPFNTKDILAAVGESELILGQERDRAYVVPK
jgi:excisionase family DNA binding protein